MLKLKKGYDQLVREATRNVENAPPVKALELAERDDVIIIDVRDLREMKRDGCIPGSYHVPRGLLESWIDPDSEYFKPVFGEDHTVLICCASGRRSALAALTMQEMGFEKVVNMAGGFAAWKLLEGPTSEYDQNEHVDLFDPEDQLVRL